MRKTPAFLAILGLTAAGLVGCSTSPADGCARVTDTDPAATDLVTVTGEFGEAPDVEVYTPFQVDELAWTDLTQGVPLCLSSSADRRFLPSAGQAFDR